MALEIDSTEIIAYFAHLQEMNEQMTLSYRKIRELADRLEEMNSSVLTCCDRISIDAFRCTFPHHVRMESTQLVIENMREIHARLERLMPPPEIIEMIRTINQNANETYS